MGYSNNKYIRTKGVSNGISSNQFTVSVSDSNNPSTFVVIDCSKVQFPKAIGTTDFIVFECSSSSGGFSLLHDYCSKKIPVSFKITQSNGCVYNIDCTGHFVEYPDIYFNKVSSKTISVRFFFSGCAIGMRVG